MPITYSILLYIIKSKVEKVQYLRGIYVKFKKTTDIVTANLHLFNMSTM